MSGRREAGDPPAICSRKAHLSRQRASPFAGLEHGQHGKGSIRILRQSAIADLGKAPQTLEGQERKLDLGTGAGLPPVRFLVGVGQWSISVLMLSAI